MKKEIPSMDVWLKEAKAEKNASEIGMYLVHNGVVRRTARAKVREGREETPLVREMVFSCDREKLDRAVEAAREMPGIFYVRVWLNEGRLQVGDDLMYVMVGGDIRPRVTEALQYLVGRIKEECVAEQELLEK